MAKWFALVIGLVFLSPAAFAGVPLVATQPAGWTASNSATLNGMVSPNSLPTTAWFRWGTSTNYGNQTAPTAVGLGNKVVRVSAQLNSLFPEVVFHFQLVASNSVGVTYGADQTAVLGRDIWSWGHNYGGTPPPSPGAFEVAAIAAGSTHSLALSSDGNVTAWGVGAYGQLNVPASLSGVVAIASGYYHSLALDGSGRVTAWGANQYGQTNSPAGLNNVIAVTCGTYHSLALKGDGTVVAWGNNSNSQTNVPADLTNVVAVAAGRYHSLALKIDGTVVGWGDNSSGQLNIPAGLANVVAIAAGNMNNLALLKNGTVVAWGSSLYNETSVPVGLANVIAIAQGDSHSLALKADGTIVGWGDDSYGQPYPPSQAANSVAISAEGDRSLALSVDVPPIANPQTVSGIANISLPIQLTGSDPENGAVFMKITSLPTGGALYQYATNSLGAPVLTTPILTTNTRVTDPNGMVTFISALNGFGSPYATFQFVASNGTLDSAPATITINLTGPPYVTTMRPAMFTTNSAVLCGMATPNLNPTTVWFEWGTTTTSYAYTNIIGSIGSGANVVYLTNQITNLVATVPYHCRLVASNISSVTYGADQVFGIAKTNSVWGENNRSQGKNTMLFIEYYTNQIPAVTLDDGTFFPATNQINSVSSFYGFVDSVYVGAGYYHSMAISPISHVYLYTNDIVWDYHTNQVTNTVISTNIVGTLQLWGDDSGGQVSGVTKLIDPNQPVMQAAGGDLHSIALLKGGRVICWGDNSYGQCNVPSAAANNVVAIAAGSYHNLALKSDGTVVAWGASIWGQTGVPVGLNNVVGIAAGFGHSVALRNDGTVIAWGDNTYGQLVVPAAASNLVAIVAGDDFCAGLRADRRVIAWGDNGAGQTTVPADLTDAVSIAAGSAHMLAIRSDYSLVAWGLSNSGQTTIPPICANLIGIAAGGKHNLALMGDRPPVPTNQFLTITNTLTSFVITLTGGDPDAGDSVKLKYIIKTPPARGTLYQYDSMNKVRGPAIFLANTAVTSVSNQVLFVPDPGDYGCPYATILFSVSDGIYQPAPTNITINIPGRPFAITSPVTNLTNTSATFVAAISPNLNQTAAWFRWGLTTNYGAGTITTYVGAGSNSAPLTFQISGLLPATTYHYMAVATNSAGGNAVGNDVTFTTPPSSPRLVNSVSAPNGFTLNFTGFANMTYSVWATTNLSASPVNWAQIGTAALVSGNNFQFIDNNKSQYPQRFYQLRWP